MTRIIAHDWRDSLRRDIASWEDDIREAHKQIKMLDRLGFDQVTTEGLATTGLAASVKWANDNDAEYTKNDLRGILDKPLVGIKFKHKADAVAFKLAFWGKDE